MSRLLCLAAVVGLAPVLASPAGQARAAKTALAAEAPTGSRAEKGAAAPASAGPAKGGGEAAGEVTYAYLSRNGGMFKAPLFAAESQNLPVALLDDEPVTLRELTRALGGVHGALTAETHAGKKDFGPLLDRIIDARLLAREARQMGIDELPEYKDAVAGHRQTAGRELLQARALTGVKPDSAEVERLYRQSVREWKVRSVLVTKEDDAKWLEAQVKAGKKFEDLAKQLVAEKKAKGGEEGQFLGRASGLPPVVAALEKMKVGGVSAPLKLKDGFTVMKVEEIRYPDDPKAREEAVQASLARVQKATLRKYYDGLVKRYARTDAALLKSLDFEAKKPGIAALQKDQRVLTRIEGGKPITVAELAGAVAQGFYHGVEGAIKEKRVNKQKLDVLDGLTSARIVPLEVKRLGIDSTEEYKERVSDMETSLLFTKFVEKAILPELKITDEQLQAYYAAHKSDYAYPTFYKVESIAFASVGGAENAVKQLRGGTDFKWLNANASGQVKPGDRKLTIDGTLSAKGIPKDLAKLLSGAKKGDYRLYADDASKQSYVIHVVDVIGATDQPFSAVKEQVQQKVFEESLTGAIKSWAGKLRKATQVRVLLTRIGS